MIKLYHAPRTRSARILWLLEELGVPYEVEEVEFLPTTDVFFQQKTPTGKLPTLEDGDVLMCESGAITEYLVERYGDGRLAPAIGTTERPTYLQWIHWAESTGFLPLGNLVWLTRYRDAKQADDALVEDARGRATATFDFLERHLGEGPFLLGEAFSAADVMMGFTLVAARLLGQLGPEHPRVNAYLDRLQQRPALQKVLAASS